jgi:hypothetical protein
VFNDPLEAIVNKDKENDIIMGGPVKVVPGCRFNIIQSLPNGRRSTLKVL